MQEEAVVQLKIIKLQFETEPLARNKGMASYKTLTVNLFQQ